MSKPAQAPDCPCRATERSQVLLKAMYAHSHIVTKYLSLSLLSLYMCIYHIYYLYVYVFMYMYMNINMCICKLQLYLSCSFGGGLCRFNQASLKNLADLGFHCTHWLLRVAQEEHSCARGFGAGCVQSSTPSGVFGATNIQQRFSSLSMLHSSEWTCDLLWSSDTASVSNDEGMDLRWRHACNFSCSFRFRLSFQVESSKPVFGFEQVTRVTVLFSYPFSEIGKPKAESRNILDKAIVHSRCSLTQSVWPSSGFFWWIVLMPNCSIHKSQQFLPPVATFCLRHGVQAQSVHGRPNGQIHAAHRVSCGKCFSG